MQAIHQYLESLREPEAKEPDPRFDHEPQAAPAPPDADDPRFR